MEPSLNPVAGREAPPQTYRLAGELSTDAARRLIAEHSTIGRCVECPGPWRGECAAFAAAVLRQSPSTTWMSRPREAFDPEQLQWQIPPSELRGVPTVVFNLLDFNIEWTDDLPRQRQEPPRRTTPRVLELAGVHA
ncbi:MAG: hypothetical protein ACRDXX_01185 [Stackebrandtia sp.]